jgi:FkbM family methyltransferase
MTKLPRATSAVRTLLRGRGWDVVRYPGGRNPDHLRGVLLRRLGVDLVVDVGANVGQYGQSLRDWGYRGGILSFEPMRDEYTALQRLARADGRWDCVHSAVGAEAGEQTIHVAANSISSSLLPMLERHVTTAPGSAYVGDQRVPVVRLDEAAAQAVSAARHPFLKVDTQGYEEAVLEGAGELLGRFVGVELEMSLQPLYDGQQLMPQMMERMGDLGLRLARLSPGLTDAATGETLQVDGIFVRTRPTST